MPAGPRIELKVTVAGTDESRVSTSGETSLLEVGWADSVDLHVVARGADEIRLNGVTVPAVALPSTLVASISINGRTYLGASRIEARGRHDFARTDVLTRASQRQLEELLPAIRLLNEPDTKSESGSWYLEDMPQLRDASRTLRLGRFIIDNAPIVARETRRIELSPPLVRESRRQLGPTGYPVDVLRTRDLLVRSPALLEATPHGVIDLGGVPHSPTMYVSERRVTTLEHPLSQRLRWLVETLVADASALAAQLPSADVRLRTRLEEARAELSALLRDSYLVRVPAPDDREILRATPTSVPQEFQRIERLIELLLRQGRWSVDFNDLQRLNLLPPSEIFQRAVARLLIDAFGLSLDSDHLRPRWERPVASSSEWSLFYDTKALPSWRDDTSYPDDFRPDYTLIDAGKSRVVVADAKYSVDANGGPSGEAIKDAHAYMDAFGIKSIAVIYNAGLVEQQTSIRTTDIADGMRRIRLVGLDFTYIRGGDLENLATTLLDCAEVIA